MTARGTATVTCATAGWLLVAACGGSASPTSPSAASTSSFPLANLDREAVIAALDCWRASTGVTYQIVTDDTLPRLLIRSGTDGLAPWGGGRSLIDGTFPEDNSANSALVVFEPGGGSYCSGASASDLRCRYLYRHELGHALGIFENTDGGLMGGPTDTLSDREVRMMVALYSLPLGATVDVDGTWRVPPDGPSGALDDVQAAQDIVVWNMQAGGGASYRRQDRICRWELPIRVYLAQEGAPPLSPRGRGPSSLPCRRRGPWRLERRGGGGLEHLNSTLLTASPNAPAEPTLRWLKFVAHEYVHAFNVKRLRPVELGPFDDEHPPSTGSLWISEGLTTYYGDLAVVRSGVGSPEDFLAGTSSRIRQLQTSPGRLVQTLERSSLEVWTNSTSGVGTDPATTVSSYVKGAVVGLLLDARIRRLTSDTKSLDDVMRLALARFGGERGFTAEEFEATASEVAGADLSGWFTRAVRSTDELDYGEMLDWWGLRFAEADRSVNRLAPRGAARRDRRTARPPRASHARWSRALALVQGLEAYSARSAAIGSIETARRAGT